MPSRQDCTRHPLKKVCLLYVLYNSSMLQATVNQFLETNQIARNKTIILGVSGGVDSIALLHICANLGVTVIVAHLDHQLRATSDKDAALVKEHASKLRFPYRAKTVAVEALGNANKWSIETAGRKARLAFFHALAHAYQTPYVMLAHHADDQAETVLMRLIRGAGVNGLGAMQPVTAHAEITVLRPLLSVPKATLRAYATHHQLTWVEDKSNTDARFFRNRVRQTLLPQLQAENPNLIAGLNRTARLLQHDAALLKTLTDNAWAQIAHQTAESVVFARAEWLAQPIGLQLRLLKKALQVLLPPAAEVTTLSVEQAVANLPQLESGKQLPLAHDMTVQRQHDKLIVSAKATTLWEQTYPQVQVDQPQDIALTALPQRIALGAFTLTLTTQPLEAPAQPARYAVFDIEALSTATVQLRPPIAGDRMQPLGMQGKSRKLEKIFTSQKIPAAARRNWPLLTNDGVIIWLCGLRLSEKARLPEQSQQRLYCLLEKA